MPLDLQTVIQERDAAVAQAAELSSKLKATEEAGADVAAALKTVGPERDALRAKVDALSTNAEASAKRIKELEAAEQDLEKRVAARMTALGVGKGAVPPGSGPGAAATGDLLAEYEAMPEGKAKSAFFNANKRQLLDCQRARDRARALGQ